MRRGNGIQIMWLHGFVFFGSANRLLLRIKDIVGAQGHGVCRVVLLDFRQVLGINSTAVLSLIKLRHFAEGEGLSIVLSGLPAAVEHTLRGGGFLGAEYEATVRAFPDLDAALEWCEDKLLAQYQDREEALRSADEWLAREIGSQDLFMRLVSYLEMVEYLPGDVMFDRANSADCLFLLYSGRASVLMLGGLTAAAAAQHDPAYRGRRDGALSHRTARSDAAGRSTRGRLSPHARSPRSDGSRRAVARPCLPQIRDPDLRRAARFRQNPREVAGLQR